MLYGATTAALMQTLQQSRSTATQTHAMQPCFQAQLYLYTYQASFTDSLRLHHVIPVCCLYLAPTFTCSSPPLLTAKLHVACEQYQLSSVMHHHTSAAWHSWYCAPVRRIMRAHLCRSTTRGQLHAQLMAPSSGMACLFAVLSDACTTLRAVTLHRPVSIKGTVH